MGLFSFFKKDKVEEKKKEKEIEQAHIEINRENCKDAKDVFLSVLTIVF